MSCSDDDFAASILAGFRDESIDALDGCEEILLRASVEGAQAEAVDSLFRAYHTIKGSGAIVGRTELVGLAHRIEGGLSLLREQPQGLSAACCSLLLRLGDAIRTHLKSLPPDPVATWDEELVEKDIAALEAELGVEASSAPQAYAAPMSDDILFAFEPGDSLPAFAPATELAPAVATAVATTAAAQGNTPAQAGGTFKIDALRVDVVLDLIGELVVLKSQLMNHVGNTPQHPELQCIFGGIDRTVRELQDRALAMRMTPLRPIFTKLERLVRDLAPKLGKSVELCLNGRDTEIDRTMVEIVSDPLMHLVRNALDHGFESTALRLEAGKPGCGTLTVTAAQRGSRIEIRVQDDGRGIDTARVVEKARAKGLLPDGATAANMDVNEIYALLMHPGFSTAERVTDVSGRGVGLDVVKNHIERLKGRIEIRSKPGSGTEFILSIPLTASIIDGMIVEAHGRPFVVPMERIRELVKGSDCKVVVTASGQGNIMVRGAAVQWEDLALLSDGAGQDLSDGAVRDSAAKGVFVLVEGNGSLKALRVDAVMGQAQVVMKPLDAGFLQGSSVAGAAVLGDGRVSLVLDLESICFTGRGRGVAA